MLRYQIVPAMFLLACGLVCKAGQSYPVLAAGTEVAVQLQERIDSETASPGDTFAAEVHAAIEGDGKALVPAGSPARVRLVTDTQVGSGGSAVYAIELDEIQVGGNWYAVTTGFADPKSGVRRIRAGDESDIPRGTTDIDKIVAAPAQGEDAALATVRGAGVSFQILHGPEIVADDGLLLYFKLAELVSLRPEEVVAP